MKAGQAVRKEVIKIKRSTSLRAILNLFKGFNTPPLIPVVNDEDVLIGVVYIESLLDLLRPQQTKLFRNIPFMDIDEDIFDLEPIPAMGDLIIADDIMTAEFTTISQDDSLEEVYKIMRLDKKERLPVVGTKGELVGILGIFDIILQMFKDKKIA